MLQTIFFYIFAWWFVPLNSHKQLKIRIGLSAFFMLLYLAAGITVLITEVLKDDGMPMISIIPFIIVVGIGIRMAKDDMRLNSDEIVAQEKAKESVKAEKQATSKYEKLIEQCGTKFFIKYYKQVKALPIRDVTVREDYPFEEKQERLLAVKGIIDLDLVEFTLNKIINSYGEILEQSYIEKAKALLLELHGETVEEKESEIDNGESERYTTTISSPLWDD